MKKFIFLCLLASVFTLSLFTSNGIAEQQINSNEQIGKEVQSMSKNRIAVFETNMGTFEIELFEDKAPITTGNFIDLAEHNFYDGLIFHRVIDGFMIQGGDHFWRSTRRCSHTPRYRPDASSQVRRA